ncbi:MAG: M28 family peptidase [Chloroflexia bacterium]|nr:M28 family peptidase [Chloroflexia bacterium]
MEEKLDIVRALAETIGPRPPTSAAEAQAAAFANAHMRREGLDVEVQTFRAVPTYALPYGLVYLFLALVPLLYLYSPPAALILSVLGLLAFVLETLSFPVLSSWLAVAKSQNIIGTRPAAQESYQHLVVLAHLDSARSALFFHPRLRQNLRGMFLLQMLALILLPVLVGLGWALGLAWLWYLQWVPAAYLVLLLLLLLHRELFMPQVAGANDNASGVAVLLQLARELDNLQYTTLWLVASGCAQSGLHGIRQFLRRYPFPKEDTYILNLDSLGKGQISIIVEEGLLWAHQADPLLVDLAGQIDADNIRIDAEPRTFHLLSTEAQVPLVRGFRTLTLSAMQNGQRPDWHWPSDTVEQVDPAVLERAFQLAGGIARQLDRMAAEARGRPLMTAEEQPSDVL